METKQSLSPLDFSVNSVLDVTLRKIGRLSWKLAKAVWNKVRNKEVKELKQRITGLEATLAAR